MATTTNYGWTTPDDTALVKDGAAAIRTLGTSVDTTTKNLNPSTTLGDIEYRSSSANVNTRLGIGSTGQVLTVAGGVPTWAASAGGGKVLQVVQGTLTTAASTSSSSYVDTGLEVSITPSSSTSRILVIVHQDTFAQRGGGVTSDGVLALFRLLRNTTALQNTFVGYQGHDSRSGYAIYVGASHSYLDSPATTSATTYKTQFANSISNSVVVDASATNIASIIAMEIGA